MTDLRWRSPQATKTVKKRKARPSFADCYYTSSGATAAGTPPRQTARLRSSSPRTRCASAAMGATRARWRRQKRALPRQRVRLETSGFYRTKKATLRADGLAVAAGGDSPLRLCAAHAAFAI
eukprot:6002062-Prymnesium_polylepis.1